MDCGWTWPLISRRRTTICPAFDQGAVDFYKVGGEGQVGIPYAIYPSMLYYQKENV